MVACRSELGILQAELGVLQMAVADAVERAAAGESAEGYAILLAGLRRVEEFAAEDSHWARELMPAYHAALECYDREYCRGPRGARAQRDAPMLVGV